MSVVLKKHIIEEVAEKTGYDEKIIKNIFDSTIEFFHDQIENNKDLLTFGFRNLATFHANFRMMQSFINRYDIVKHRYKRLNELEATSRHVDLPLAWVLFRNHTAPKNKKEFEEENGTKWYLPRLSWTGHNYYYWLKRVEEIHNEKCAKYFK